MTTGIRRPSAVLDAAALRTRPAWSDTFSSPRASLRCVGFQAPVLLITITGFGDAHAATRIIDWIRAASAAAPVHVFQDWRAMTGYDSDARELLTAFVNDIGERMPTAALFVNSRLLAMGVQVANLLLRGKLTVHANEAAFSTAMRTLGGDPCF